ncbi:MAG: RHS repeat-associated core domain-containing protein [Gordonia amarae]
MTGQGRTRYRYDRAGQMVGRRRTRLSRPAETTTFTYTGGGQIRTVDTGDGTAWTYRYDPFGRRVGKTHTRRDGTILASTVLAWDGDQLIGQHHTDHGTGDQRSTVWTYHPGTDQPLTQHTTTSRSGSGGSGGDVRSWSQSRVDTEFHAIITDLADAPTELLDPHTGQVTGHATTTLWGATVWSGTGTDLRFAGQQYDRESGLHYNHHRYYNPHTATYTSTDPLGITPNPATATAYVHNPLTWIDPHGLKRNHPGDNNKGNAPGAVDKNGTPIAKRVSNQKQDRHVQGTREYAQDAAKKQGKPGSYFKTREDAQQVLDEAHDGTAKHVGFTPGSNQPMYKSPNVTGYNNNPGRNIADQPTDTFFIKGTTSPSVVPTAPRP